MAPPCSDHFAAGRTCQAAPRGQSDPGESHFLHGGQGGGRGRKTGFLLVFHLVFSVDVENLLVTIFKWLMREDVAKGSGLGWVQGQSRPGMVWEEQGIQSICPPCPRSATQGECVSPSTWWVPRKPPPSVHVLMQPLPLPPTLSLDLALGFSLACGH